MCSAELVALTSVDELMALLLGLVGVDLAAVPYTNAWLGEGVTHAHCPEDPPAALETLSFALTLDRWTVTPWAVTETKHKSFPCATLLAF